MLPRWLSSKESAVQETWVRPLGQEDPLEEGHGNPLQNSCLENPMNRGAWLATVHSVTKSRSGLKRLRTHSTAGELLKAVRGWDWEGACLQGRTTSREDRYYTLLLRDPHEPVVLNT